MKYKLEIIQALSVFEKILTYGVRQGDEFFLDGLWATPSFDGYTATLHDNDVSLNIEFHNKVRWNYDSSKDLDIFMVKLRHINEHTYTK